MSVEYFFINQSAEQQGPINKDTIMQLILAGKIKHKTHVWRTGLSQWRSAHEIDELSSLFLDNAESKRIEKSFNIPGALLNWCKTLTRKQVLATAILVATLLTYTLLHSKSGENEINEEDTPSQPGRVCWSERDFPMESMLHRMVFKTVCRPN